MNNNAKWAVYAVCITAVVITYFILLYLSDSASVK